MPIALGTDSRFDNESHTGEQEDAGQEVPDDGFEQHYRRPEIEVLTSQPAASIRSETWGPFSIFVMSFTVATGIVRFPVSARSSPFRLRSAMLISVAGIAHSTTSDSGLDIGLRERVASLAGGHWQRFGAVAGIDASMPRDV
jgi:hypothetical protein